MPEKIQVVSSNCPPPTGPYSPAIIAGNLVFLAGQGGFDPVTNEIERGIIPETRKTLQNIEGVLKDCGCGLKDIVKITTYLADVSEFAQVNEVFREMLPQPFPARTTVQVYLRRDIRIEIDVVAVIPDK